MKHLLALTLPILAFASIGCKTTDEGTRNIIVYKGAIEEVKAPSDGFYSTLHPYRENYGVNVQTFTEEAKDVKVQSKDNTPIHLGSLKLTAHTAEDRDAIMAYVRKFGFEEKTRHEKRNVILLTQLETEARKAFSQFDAYAVYANQETIQQNLFERMKKIGQDELFLVVESVQFGNWGFEDPQVEKAASAVVANRKSKEAEDAALDAARVRQTRQEIEGRIFENPALLRLEVLKYQLWIEQARSQGIERHQGNLTILYGQQPTTLQLPSNNKE